jgi:DNA topoisomerase-1
VNTYLKGIAGGDVTAKDFRTWAGTVLTTQVLNDQSPKVTVEPNDKQVTAAIKSAAKQLGNRPATCRKYYVHPKVPTTYLKGKLLPAMQSACDHLEHLNPCECAVMKVLSS